MGCAYVNGFPVIAESLRVGILRTSVPKDNLFLAWRGESWLEECLEIGPRAGQSHSLCDKRKGYRLVECLFE